AAVAAMLFDTQHVRDDLTGLLDDDPVALFDAQPHEFVAVVKTGAGDRGAGDVDGFEVGDGGDRAGLANVHGNFANARFSFVAFPLVGNEPPRTLGGEPEALPLLPAVDLEDQAVNLEIEGVQFLHHDLRVPEGVVETV